MMIIMMIMVIVMKIMLLLMMIKIMLLLMMIIKTVSIFWDVSFCSSSVSVQIWFVYFFHLFGIFKSDRFWYLLLDELTTLQFDVIKNTPRRLRHCDWNSDEIHSLTCCENQRGNWKCSDWECTHCWTAFVLNITDWHCFILDWLNYRSAVLIYVSDWTVEA